jgi:epoxyqueuosine reductase
MGMQMEKLLLSVCCAECAKKAVEHLKDQYEITLYLSLQQAKKDHSEILDLAKSHGLKTISEKKNSESWEEEVGNHREAVDGERCIVCLDFSLDNAAKFAGQNGFDSFSTTIGKDDALCIANEKSAKYSIAFVPIDTHHECGCQFKNSPS